MLHQSLDEVALEIVEDWLLEVYEKEEVIEPIYLYMKKNNAQSLYGTKDLSSNFVVTEYKNEMIKLVRKEPMFAH